MVAIVEHRNPAAKNHPKIRFNAGLKKQTSILLRSELSNLVFCNDGYSVYFYTFQLMTIKCVIQCDDLRQS